MPYKSKSLSIVLHAQDSGDLLHVLAVGHAGPAVGPVYEDRLHDGAHGKEGGRHGNAGIGINTFLSVFIHSVRRNKRFSLGLYTHQCSL